MGTPIHRGLIGRESAWTGANRNDEDVRALRAA